MEDLKNMVQDCLGPLPRVCQEQVLLDMERARMQAEDWRGRLIQINELCNEALDYSEHQRREAEGYLGDATLTLRQLIDHARLSQRSRDELTSVHNLLSEAAGMIEIVAD